MNNICTLSVNDTRTKRPLSTYLDGWILSNNPAFVTPLANYVQQWPNTKFKSVDEHTFFTQGKSGGQAAPDMILLDGNTDWVTIAKGIKQYHGDQPQVILLTEKNDTQILRHALKSGIKDVLMIPFDEEELEQLFHDCAAEKRNNCKQGKVSVVMNAKGGMGATIIATTIAHLIALEKTTHPVLIDTDAQFGCSANLLSTKPKFTLGEALDQVDELDEYALSGMLTKHESGLKFIPSRSQELLDNLPEMKSISFNRFLLQVKNNFDHVIVDLSRGLESTTLPAIAEASNIYIVVQQCIPAISEAANLIKQLKHLMGINQQSIQVIVNRYSKNNEIKPDEIKRSLHVDKLILIPNDYTSVNSSTNLGELLATHYPQKPIVKALTQVSDAILEKESEQVHGLKRIFSFLRS
ncbi:AAA family ATPase [Photobacterium sp. MCCC 1A19761]|uniref:AAA family ATPase n=1 Tax=Photobacterium sp. MCCC 1A19761 TaxID=3115000 RepID=UPI00307EB7B0